MEQYLEEDELDVPSKEYGQSELEERDSEHLDQTEEATKATAAFLEDSELLVHPVSLVQMGRQMKILIIIMPSVSLLLLRFLLAVTPANFFQQSYSTLVPNFPSSPQAGSSHDLLLSHSGMFSSSYYLSVRTVLLCAPL